jgi:hypothetical protein
MIHFKILLSRCCNKDYSTLFTPLLHCLLIYYTCDVNICVKSGSWHTCYAFGFARRTGCDNQRRKSCDWRHLCRRTTLVARDVEEWWLGNWWRVVGDPNQEGVEQRQCSQGPAHMPEGAPRSLPIGREDQQERPEAIELEQEALRSVAEVLAVVTLATCKWIPSRDCSSCGRLGEWKHGWNQHWEHRGCHRRIGHRACPACPGAERSRHRHAHQSAVVDWVKGARLGRLGSTGAVDVGQGSEGSDWSSLCHREFLKSQVIVDLQKTRKWVGAAQMQTESMEALVKASDNVKD